MIFLVAAIFEIGGYYIPWIDNLLDTIASPASIVAGTVITASFVTGLDPWLQWLLGVIAGGASLRTVLPFPRLAGAALSTFLIWQAADRARLLLALAESGLELAHVHQLLLHGLLQRGPARRHLPRPAGRGPDVAPAWESQRLRLWLEDAGADLDLVTWPESTGAAAVPIGSGRRMLPSAGSR